MHPEQEPQQRDEYPTTASERAEHAVEEYLVDAPVGSVKFTAFSDYAMREYYRIMYWSHVESLLSGKEMHNSGEEPRSEFDLYTEDGIARILEAKMGTMQAHIDIEDAQTPGYANHEKAIDWLHTNLEAAYKADGIEDSMAKAIHTLREARDRVIKRERPQDESEKWNLQSIRHTPTSPSSNNHR